MTASKIIQSVCRHFATTEETLLSKSRKEGIRYPRQVLTYMLYNRKIMNCIQIKNYLNQNHSTVLSSVKVIQDMIDVGEEDVLLDVDVIGDMIEGTNRFRKIEEKETIKINRPPAEYSNRQHHQIINEYLN